MKPKEKLGIPTASNFHYIITAEGKASRSQERKSYIYKLCYERITGEEVKSTFHNEWTERGVEIEPEAADALEKHLGSKLLPGRFVVSANGRFGCTPDRFVKGRHEAVEIKSPAGWTHIGHMAEGAGSKYAPQVQGQLLVGGYDAVHFWSWHPRFCPVHIVTRVDEAYQRTLISLLKSFCDELDATEDFVRRYGMPGQLVWGSNTGVGDAA